MIKLKDILLGSDKLNILIPRRNKEERQKNYQIVIQKKIQKIQKDIQEYIKNGSKGNLDLENTPIQALPDNLTVGGSLYLSNTPIQRLPNNLTVGFSLDLSNTPIKTLPDNLTKVGGNLDLSNTPIKTLPDNLSVGGSLN